MKIVKQKQTRRAIEPSACPNLEGQTSPAARSAGGASIGRNLCNPPHKTAEYRVKRRLRYDRRAKSSQYLKSLGFEDSEGNMKYPAPARCGWTIGQYVGIAQGEGAARFNQVETCSSIHVCPICSAVIRSERADEIREAVEKHQASGGELLFFTGTLPHSRQHRIAVTMDVVLKAWQSTINGSPWKRVKKLYEISGYIRSLESTLGEHGAHNHIHALLFLDRHMSDTEFNQFRDWLFDRWANRVESVADTHSDQPIGRPQPQALNLQRVDEKGQVLAQYLGKVQEEKDGHLWGVEGEISRGDLKQAGKGGISPYQLLDEHCFIGSHELSEGEKANLWREFYQATKGRRAITWSRGLKARFGIDEVTDDEIMNEDTQGKTIYLTTAKAYRKAKTEGKIAQCLEWAEDENWTRLARILPRVTLDEIIYPSPGERSRVPLNDRLMMGA